MSTLSYFINQLDKFDPTLHEPLIDYKWGRDIKLRTDVSFANESASFTRSAFAAVGTNKATGKPWLSATQTALPNVSVNGERVVQPLRLLGHELSYSSVQLERSMLLGQPIDVAQFAALNKMYQMYTDEMVYIGDSELGVYGLLNSDLVTAASVTADGTGSSTLWSTKTPDQILRDVNDMIQTAWAASGYAVCPDKLLLPPAQFAYISSQKVSTAGNVSILTYLEDNSISLRVNGRKLDIQAVKWLTGRGADGADRMICYTNDDQRVRFPLVPIRRETPYFKGIHYNAPYIWAFGQVEFIYPETVLYRDGI